MCGETCLVFIQKWKLWIRPFLILTYALLVITIIPILVINSIHNGFNKKEQGTLIAGAFVLMTLPIAFWTIIQHIIYYTQPTLQKHIIRILWMVPIYAINAWVGLLYPEQSIYVDSLRECYEAYVIYNFMKYLLNYLNMEMDLEANLENMPQVKHFFPLCCLTPWEMGREFVHMCKHGILQYTVVRPVTTAISVICEIAGVYGEGDFRGDVAFPYIIAINNFSQFVAMYCLVLFYEANKVALRPMSPLGKFLCIKAVVFFSFFQGVIINVLVYYGVITSVFDTSDDDTIKTMSSKLQDFLICIEMFLAAIAHHYSFSYKPFINANAVSQSCCESFVAMWDVSDVHHDIQEHLGIVGSSLSRRIRGRSMYSLARGSESENSRLVCSAPENLGAPFEYNSNCNETDETDSIKPGSGTYGSVGQSDSSAPLLIHLENPEKESTNENHTKMV